MKRLGLHTAEDIADERFENKIWKKPTHNATRWPFTEDFQFYRLHFLFIRIVIQSFLTRTPNFIQFKIDGKNIYIYRIPY